MRTGAQGSDRSHRGLGTQKSDQMTGAECSSRAIGAVCKRKRKSRGWTDAS